MSSPDLPVLVGAAQLLDRERDPLKTSTPLEMLRRAGLAAGEDAGPGTAILRAIDTIALVEVLAWHPTNGPRLLGEALGCERLSSEFDCATGGETPVALVNMMAERIYNGDSEVALVAGCNNIKTLRVRRKAGLKLGWEKGGSGKSQLVGSIRPGSNDEEIRYGLDLPPSIYPIFENALRASRGQTLEQHRVAMGKLMSPFTKVAADNPDAWFPVERSAEELTTPTAENRMVAYPYTKYLNAFMDTDQASAVVVMSQEKARELGVPEDKWVHWRGGAKQNEAQWFATTRPDFAKCPAVQACHEAALERAGLSLDEIEAFDFYSCFPVAVSMACDMIGMSEDDPRGHTVTGGLPYAGGPASAYSLHAIATMMDRIRSGSAATGMVTGNGWYLTKHSAVVLANQPATNVTKPEFGTAWDDASAEMNVPAVEICDEANGDATVETYTMIYDREGRPARGIVVGRTDEGNRFLANTPDDLCMNEQIVEKEFIGVQGKVAHIDGTNRFEPK